MNFLTDIYPQGGGLAVPNNLRPKITGTFFLQAICSVNY
jgi:hypothetical protein